MKPHIRWSRFFGEWVCNTGGFKRSGYGRSPRLAYESFLRNNAGWKSV